MRGRGAGLALGVLLGLAGAVRAAEPAPSALKAGDVLDRSNAAAARDLLPADILAHYQSGEYRNAIVDYPLTGDHWEASFDEATKKNATTLDVNDAGAIVVKTTGKQPGYVYGIPFPTVDPGDPKAATKVVWNQFLAYWNGGSSYNVTRVIMLQPQGVDREIQADGWFKFWDGQSEKYRDAENPLNLQSQFLGVATSPADLNGTASLTWRYRDADKRDSVWAYVPALRRVRAVSPSNRSDGYLGSDISGDDGFFFDGKPEDFTWEVVGKRDGLRIVDPATVTGTVPVEAVPGGGWVNLTRDGPSSAGFEDKQWKGVSWAPLNAALAKRPVWVVRGTPKDRYYLYGKIELWIDAISWSGSWNRKFDWKDEQVANYQLMHGPNQPAGAGNDREWVAASTQVWACAENLKMKRATLGGMRPFRDAPFQVRVPVPSKIFESTAMMRLGK